MQTFKVGDLVRDREYPEYLGIVIKFTEWRSGSYAGEPYTVRCTVYWMNTSEQLDCSSQFLELLNRNER